MINENELADERRLPRVLDKLGGLLERGWCQGIYARSKKGRKINELSDKAVCFCIQGGINNVSQGFGKDFRHRMREALAQTLTIELQEGLPKSIAQRMPLVCGAELIEWNDKNDRTQYQVVKLCRDTAQRLRAA